ncbi:hypothetical protein ACTTAI_14070 [Rhodobacter capsulatus]|uniref:hypothetical protein n=1 Tax=Rhodobacter capsulatus TaxID=1061 RepID=UPI004024FE1C
MNGTKLLLLGVAALALAGCEEAGGYASPITGSYGPDKSIDRGINAHHLSTLKAGIWVDPEGCDHWIIDDGVEGYMSERVDDYGKPICSGAAPPNTAVGPFKEGSPVPDYL